MSRLLITGGAGFVGSNLAVSLAARHPEWEVFVLDNLYRRGSELNLPRLEAAGVEFVKGDVRELDDLKRLPELSALIECSAEPSVMSGVDGDTSYLVHTNLTGAYNCLELARRDGAFMVFLSTSRVYPVEPQLSLKLEEAPTRFELAEEQDVAGASAAGISEEFPIAGARTLYGTTKLAAELLIEEYRGSAIRSNTSASAAGESRSATCSTSRIWSTWSSASFSIPSSGTGAQSTPAVVASAASRCWRRRRSAAS